MSSHLCVHEGDIYARYPSDRVTGLTRLGFSMIAVAEVSERGSNRDWSGTTRGRYSACVRSKLIPLKNIHVMLDFRYRISNALIKGKNKFFKLDIKLV